MNEGQRPIRRRLALAALVLAAALLLAGAPLATQARQGEGPIAAPPDESLDLSAPAQLMRFGKGGGHPKLDSGVQQLVAGFAGAQAAGAADTEVELAVAPGSAGAVGAAVSAAGGTVRFTSRDGTRLQVRLPVAALTGIADNAEVLAVRTLKRAFAMEPGLATGEATVETLGITSAANWHEAGFTGEGVKIGVIDLSFTGATALIGTDLPPEERVTIADFTGEGFEGDGDAHGTACAEIIYDLAPGASLYLARVSTPLELEAAVLWMLDEGVSVISSSLGYYNFGPGDGTGPLAELAEFARESGTLWVTAAGNERERHWGGPAVDGDGDGFLRLGLFELNYFNEPIAAGERIAVAARWSDWDLVTQDLELLLYRWNGQQWNLVAASIDDQAGQPGQQPTELLTYTTQGPATYYGVALFSYAGGLPEHVEFFAPNAPAGLLIQTPARSIVDLADSPAALTVAAVDSSFPYYQEPYSAEGPTNGPGGTRQPSFLKPDITGFANVATVSYGEAGFGGTSAATPHVAGAAALVFGSFEEATPRNVKDFLLDRAIDRGRFGPDTKFGYGQLFLGRPPIEAARDDFSGDGVSDVMWRNDDLGATIYQASAIPLGAASAVVPPVGNIGERAVALGDFTGDGHTDVLWIDPDTRIVSLTDVGAGETNVLGRLFATWSIAGAGDFNNDGVDDLLVRNGTLGLNQIWLMAAGDISRAYNTMWIHPNYVAAGVGDVNGDGNDDIIWWSQRSGRVIRLLMDQQRVIDKDFLDFYPGGTDWRISAVADFNDDGVDDLLWHNQGEGELGGHVRIFFMADGQPALRTWSVLAANLDWRIAAVGDYNGDGMADLYWRNLATGERFLSVLENGLQVDNVRFGAYDLTWSVVGQGAYDGIRLADLGVSRLANSLASGPRDPEPEPPDGVPVTPIAGDPGVADVRDSGQPDGLAAPPNDDLTIGEGVDVDAASARTLAMALNRNTFTVYLPDVAR